MTWRGDKERFSDEDRRLNLKVAFSRQATEFRIFEDGLPVIYFRAHRLPTDNGADMSLYYIKWGVSVDVSLEHGASLGVTRRRELITEVLEAYKLFYGRDAIGHQADRVEVVFDVRTEAET